MCPPRVPKSGTKWQLFTKVCAISPATFRPRAHREWPPIVMNITRLEPRANNVRSARRRERPVVSNSRGARGAKNASQRSIKRTILTWRLPLSHRVGAIQRSRARRLHDGFEERTKIAKNAGLSRVHSSLPSCNLRIRPIDNSHRVPSGRGGTKARKCRLDSHQSAG
jgi:hypothetical protein